MPSSSIATSDINSETFEELNKLMDEFPDWKQRFPDAYRELNPPRYSKNKASGPPQKYDGSLNVQKRSQTVAVTDYRSTFKKHKTRPRSTKKPPPSPREMNPPPMSFSTNQRSEYIDRGPVERTQLIKKEQEYEPPSDKFELKSGYERDYPNKFVLPEIHNVPEKFIKGSMKMSDARFDGMTTSKEHFKNWKTNPAKSFGEVPVFTASILYPDQNRHLETTTGRTFKGAKGKRADLCTKTEANIKIEGHADFDTVNSLTYKNTNGAKAAEIMVQKPEYVVKKRGQIASKSLTQMDFGGFGGKNPQRTYACEPAPATLDLRFDNEMNMDTEQRNQYKGVDVIRHPMPKLCKKEDETYRPPDAKFDMMTSHEADYQPVDVSKYHNAPAKNPHRESMRSKSLPRLDSTTTNKHFYKPWEVSPHQRMDDFHEAIQYARRDIYMPPSEKFNATTTTQDVFRGKTAPIPKAFKPEEKPIESKGKHDFDTVYKVEFHQPNNAKRLPKKVASQLLKELRQQKKDAMKWNETLKPTRLQAC